MVGGGRRHRIDVLVCIIGVCYWNVVLGSYHVVSLMFNVRALRVTALCRG